MLAMLPVKGAHPIYNLLRRISGCTTSTAVNNYRQPSRQLSADGEHHFTRKRRDIRCPANITINANASDSDGTVSKVEFFNGATKLGESLDAPYSFAWNNVAAGATL